MSVINLKQKEIAAVSGANYSCKYGAKDVEDNVFIQTGIVIGTVVGMAIGAIGGRAILAWKHAPQPTAASRIKTFATIYGIEMVFVMVYIKFVKPIFS